MSSLAYLVSPLLKPRAKVDVPIMSSPNLANYLELPKLAPAAAAAAAVHGLVFGSVPGLIPKWGVDTGVSVALIGQALSVMQVGGVFMQLPLSLASDRFDRRLVMALACFATAAISLLLLQVPTSSRFLWLTLMFLWGGFASTLYSLASAHAGDLAPPERRVAWVSSIMLIWGSGATLGPLVASLLMDSRGSSLLWSYAAAVSMVTGAFLVWRKIIRPG